MEDLLEELGEGFHGEELDKQIALIDKRSSGFLDRTAFIEWYQELSSSVGEGDGNDVISLDSDEEEEWGEQVELVQTIFDEKGTEGGATLEAPKFADLIEGLGTVYCEDKGGAHARAKKKLTKKGLISIDDFLAWYKNYLFGDDESSVSDGDTSDNDAASAAATQAQSSAKPPFSSWGNTFALEEGSWKCEICSVRNKASAAKCAACETTRPGSESEDGPSKGASKDTPASSIGPSGFTFGAASSGAGTGASSGLTFGAPPAKSTPSSGFSFGAPPAPATSNQAASGGSTGFSFGAPEKSTGFTFGLSQVNKGNPWTAPAESRAGSAAPKPSSAYPPTASKAPQPFGAAAGATKKTSAASGYPPTASKAPSPFSATATTPKPVSAAASGYPPDAGRAPSFFSAASNQMTMGSLPTPNQQRSMETRDPLSVECSKQYGYLVKEMEKTLHSLKNRFDGGDMNHAVVAVVNDLRTVFAAIADTTSLGSLVGNRVAKIAKERSDLLAKIAEIGQNLEDPGVDEGLLETQPLDLESERIQRFLSSQAMKLVDSTTMLEARAQLLEDLSEGDIREMTETILETHQETSELQDAASKLRSKSIDLDTLRAHARPQVSQAIVAASNQNPPKQVALGWNDVDSSKFKSFLLPSRTKVSLKRTTRNSHNLRATPNASTTTARALSLSMVRRLTHSTQPYPADSPFSPPRQETTRDLWDKQSSKLDQHKAQQLDFSSPRELKQTSIAAESPKILSGYGTSVEKIRGLTPNRASSKPPSSSVQTGSMNMGQSLSIPPDGKSTTNERPTSRTKTIGDSRHVPAAPPSVVSKRPPPGGVDGMHKGDGSLGGPLGGQFSGMGITATGKSRDLSGASVGNTTSAPAKVHTKPQEQDYEMILTEFYKKHNPSKLSSVASTIKKYHGREREMFSKLAQKYGVASPLDQTLLPTEQKSTKGNTITSSFQQQGDKTPAFSGTAKPPLAPSPFLSSQSNNPQTTVAPSSASPFLSTSPPAPGQKSGGSFSLTGPQGQTSFSQTSAQPSTQSTASFAGKPPREMLYKFYQEYNPNKIGEVDKLLTKYAGKEEQMFRKLAQKYNLDPTVFGLGSFPTPAPGGFGQSPPPVPSGFGHPPPPAPSGFGQSPPPAPSGFGQSPGSGFGQASVLGSPSPFGSPAAPSPALGFSTPSAAAPAFGSGLGASPSSTFGSLAAGSQPTFGSLAHNTGAPPSTFGSFSQNSNPSGFGQSSFGASFGNPRR